MCGSCRVVSLVSVVVKMCGKVLVERIREGTEGMVCDCSSFISISV